MLWIQCIENGPRRVNHAAAALNNLIYSFGGYSNTQDYTRVTAIDIHILNIHSLKWYLLPIPQVNDPQYSVTPFSRYGHTVVVYKRKFYLWGGRNDHPIACNRLFCFNPGTRQWSVVPIVGDYIPSARDGHSACVINDRMYVFGGFEDQTQQFSNELFYFDFKTSTWQLRLSKVGDVLPSWRDFHTATNVDGRMYVFGGRFDHAGPQQTTLSVYDDRLYVYDVDDDAWSLVTTKGQTPCGRRSHSAFSHNGNFYIFGGYNSTMELHFNDLFEFNPSRSIWRRVMPLGISNPTPRRRQCCLIISDRMYMFGGTSPVPTSRSVDEPNENNNANLRTDLHDQSDLYVLDLAPTLRTLCLLFLAVRTINANILPKKFSEEYRLFAQSMHIQSRTTGSNSR